ncbi:TPA: deoxyribose-phosphate aldolase [Candidatus Bathyarchaeota archaeon]|nr:deoxyribose-phosphate aldolase [Candidatus Bathyarchaeota archaeon]
MTRERLAKLIDHTVVRPYATEGDVRKACDEAKRHGFASVCVNPCYVSLASRLLRGTGIGVCVVIGFPFGATLPSVKAFEAKEVIRRGADEIDVVINIGALKSGNYDLVRRDIESVVEVAKARGVLTKVIIEACYLTDEEKEAACKVAKDAGADFIKTSTGYGPAGATVHDVKLIRAVVGDEMGIKASGGISDAERAVAMIRAGATRIGTSNGVRVVESLTGDAYSDQG